MLCWIRILAESHKSLQPEFDTDQDEIVIVGALGQFYFQTSPQEPAAWLSPSADLDTLCTRLLVYMMVNDLLWHPAIAWELESLRQWVLALLLTRPLFTCAFIQALAEWILKTAIKTSDHILVDAALASGVSPNIRVQGVRAIAVAVGTGHVGIVNSLLQAGAKVGGWEYDLNSPLRMGRSALWIAVKKDRDDVLQILLENLATERTASFGDFMQHALIGAAENGSSRVWNCLLRFGADLPRLVKSLRLDGLEAAVRGGNAFILEQLIRQGDGDLMKRFGNDLVATAAADNKFELVQWLLGHGYQLENHAMSKACLNGNASLVAFLLKSGANPNGGDGLPQFSLTRPIAGAFLSMNADLCRMLVEHGADCSHLIGGQTFWAKCAFVMDATSGRHQFLPLLLQNGISLNPGSAHEPTLLQVAAGELSLSSVRYALSLGIDPNEPAPSLGLTALQAACVRLGKSDDAATVKSVFNIIQLLLAVGADVNGDAATYGGKTALEAAVISSATLKTSKAIGHRVVKELLQKGARVNSANSARGSPALVHAVHGNDKFLVQLLLDHGAVTESHASLECCGLASGRSGVLSAAVCANDRALTELVLRQRIDMSSTSNHLAIFVLLKKEAQGDVAILQKLILSGLDVNSHWSANSRWSVRTPLDRAIQVGNRRLAEVLLKAGARSSLSDDDTLVTEAVSICAETGNLSMLHLLLHPGVYCDRFPKPRISKAALWSAALKGHIQVLMELLATSSLVGVTTSSWLLMTARHANAISFQLGERSPSEDMHVHPQVPLDHAAYWGHLSLVQQFLRDGAGYNSEGYADYWRAAHLAKQNGHLAVSRAILEFFGETNSLTTYVRHS